MAGTQPQDRHPVDPQDAKFLAAVVDSVRCAFERYRDKPKALRECIAQIVSEDGVGQALANVVNAHCYQSDLTARTLVAGSTVKLQGLPFVLASDALVLGHPENLNLLDSDPQ